MNNKDIGTRALPVASNDLRYFNAAAQSDIGTNRFNPFARKSKQRLGKLQNCATGLRLTFGLLMAISLLARATAVAQGITATPGFVVTSDWGAGANASLFITNNSSVAITNRLLEFDFDHAITTYNDLNIASHVGNHYTLTNQPYYSQIIAPGGMLTFDMQVNPGSLNGAQPTNYLINGVPLAGYVPPLTLAVGNASVVEGAGSSSNLSFSVTLSRAATNTVSVNFATVAGTAAAGVDYVGTNGTLVFNVGVTQQTINVIVIGSSLPKPNESFTLVLTNATGATIATGTGTGTIDDNSSLAVTDYPDWRASHGIGTNVSDLATPEHDGINILWKYALNLDPNVPDATNSPLSTRVENGQLKFSYPKYRADIAYELETSDNLFSWSTNGVAQTPNGYLNTASVPAPLNVTSRFLSLRIHQLPHTSRFLQHYANLHNPANGYFSTNGIPYHSAETLISEAPDYGHETTSEAYSYYFWLETMYGRLTGDWSHLGAAWTNMETYMIPSHADQPSNAGYNASKPATYAPEWELPSRYPALLNSGAPVGTDPLAAELNTTYGSADLYGMHWLLDVDNWYGFGRQEDGVTRPSFINTFQRGKQESVWETVPQPCWDALRWGGPNGYLDLFTGGTTYTPQWKYTDAPDADARAIQTIYWAKTWADAQGGSAIVDSLVPKAAHMGDCLRYAMYDKYFRNVTNSVQAGTGRQSCNYLLDWYYAWGGSTNAAGGWAWRIGCSHAHFGYQNPLAAWALGNAPGFIPRSPTAQQDWTNSLHRQLEFYRWLQSNEGAIAGGATSSWDGRYDPMPAGTSTFYGMGYQDAPVYDNPPSNQWFGMQAWSMERLAEYYYLTNDPLAKEILDKWVAWVLPLVQLPADGTFAIPGDLAWSGQPDAWNPASPGANANLHVTVLNTNQDVGLVASLSRTLLYYSAATKQWGIQNTAAKNVATNLLERLWINCRDNVGVSVAENRSDYRQFFDQPIYAPASWIGHMPDGDTITNNVSFVGLRSKYLQDPSFPALKSAYTTWVNSGSVGSFQSPQYHYHRFWAQVEVALANATYDVLFPND